MTDPVYCAWCGCYLGSTPEEVGDCPDCARDADLLEELMNEAQLRAEYERICRIEGIAADREGLPIWVGRSEPHDTE